MFHRCSAREHDPSFDENALVRRIYLFDINGRYDQPSPDTAVEEFWKQYSTLSWLQRLRDSAIKPTEVRRAADGTWLVSFENKKEFTDLTILHGMPLTVVMLGGTSVADLSPLRGMPLKELYVWNTNVEDLTPIEGMPITHLDARGSEITDLDPLKGMPLDYLDLDATPVSDLSPLRGMSLNVLRLMDCANLTDLSAVADLKKLTDLVLPPHVADLQFLHTLPNLQRLSFNEIPSGEYLPDKTTSEFWSEYGNDWRSALRKSGIKPQWMRQAADGTWDVGLDRSGIIDLSILHGAPISILSVGGNDIADLTPLRGMPLKQLVIWGTKVTDLTPLKGMQLELLWLDGTDVKDLSPLRGMPLTVLKLYSCQGVTDLSPIADAKGLTQLVLPPRARGIEFLRKFPNLQLLSYEEDQESYVPDRTADEFWAGYDGSKPQPTADDARRP